MNFSRGWHVFQWRKTFCWRVFKFLVCLQLFVGMYFNFLLACRHVFQWRRNFFPLICGSLSFDLCSAKWELEVKLFSKLGNCKITTTKNINPEIYDANVHLFLFLLLHFYNTSHFVCPFFTVFFSSFFLTKVNFDNDIDKNIN